VDRAGTHRTLTRADHGVGRSRLVISQPTTTTGAVGRLPIRARHRLPDDAPGPGE
jgi:hypothetical protein